jgi:hypothetical protein
MADRLATYIVTDRNDNLVATFPNRTMLDNFLAFLRLHRIPDGAFVVSRVDA